MKIIVASNNYAKIRAISQAFREYFKRLGSALGFEEALPFKRTKKYLEEANDPFYSEKEIVSLVINQAKEAYHEHDYRDDDKTRKVFNLSISTKQGLIKQEFGTNSDFFVRETVALYNGERVVGIGFGPACEVPRGLIKRLYDFKASSKGSEGRTRRVVEEVVGGMGGLEEYFPEHTREEIVDGITKEVSKTSLEGVVHQMTKESSDVFRLGLIGLLSRGVLRRSDCIQQAVFTALMPVMSNDLYTHDEEWTKK